MDFTGRLNFTFPQAFDDDFAEKGAFDETRINRPTTIFDARSVFGVFRGFRDSTVYLSEGVGFALFQAKSKVLDWENVREVASIHYSECRELAESLLPGARILAIESHTFRDENQKEHHYVDGIQYGPPALAVHNDYADSLSQDGRSVIKSFVDIIGLPRGKRIIGLNIWRSVSSNPLERFPLAVCDRTSIDPEDLEYKLNVNAPVPFNAHYCKPNDDQRWYYYPKMSRDEALVFLTYDSHPPYGGLFCPTLHTAVDVPDSEGLQPRQSVEVRIFAELPL
ncbi:hypothetical protein OAL14_08305 [Gammaproteobacteria bacterium]|nr:hypothetical protein [Gammaproteobacteria bacterium]